ncbi:MAG TPA: AsmA family protein [Terriglobales bacterium]|jgi:AsmA protein|nr:AsmA family protein [Terriglobales bacterium]
MKRTLRIVGIIVAVLLVIIIVVPFFVDANSFRPRLESELTAALGRQVKVGNLSFSLLSGSVGADDISIADDPAFSKEPFVRAKALRVGVEIFPLFFSKTLHVTGLTLDQPQIALLRSNSGKWNFSSLGGKSEAKPSAPAAPKSGGSPTGDLSVAKLNVTNGRVSVGKPPAKPQVYDNVNIEVRDFSATSKFPFTMSADLPGGGSLKLDGTAGPINSADASLTPLEAKLTVKRMDLAKSGFVDPAAGIAGIADLDGTLNSDGKSARVSGTLKADKLKLGEKATPASKPVQLQFALDHALQSQSGTLSQGDIAMGKAVAHLTGDYRSQGESTLLNMKLVGQNMSVDELQAMLPAVGVVLPSGSALKGGTLSLDLGINGPADKPVITGPVKLADTRLAGFNLGSKLSAVSALSGKTMSGNDTSIQNLSTNLRAAPEGIRTENINLNIPALGEVTGSGTISPGGVLNFHMNANLTGGAVSGITQMAGLGGKGGGISFLIQGTTSNPTFLPDVQGLAGGALKNVLSGQSGNQQSPLDALSGLLGKKKKKQ